MTTTHSPADVVSSIIRAAEGTNGWLVVVSLEPGTPDNVITVFDTSGKVDGRSMVSGEVCTHPGIQVRVRSENYHDGFSKCKEIVNLLNRVLRQVVVIDGTSYTVQSISMVGDPIPLGLETGTKRNLFTTNYRVSMKKE